MTDAAIEGGYADPVLDAQSAFRAIMEALANPGTVRPLRRPAGFGGLPPGLLAIAQTLADHDTPVWLSPELRADGEMAGFIAFHTGAPITDTPEDAAFAFAGHADDLPPLGRFQVGTDDYPDRSTTIVLAVPSFLRGPELTLEGPGLREPLRVAPEGLPADFVAQWIANKALFPRGIDLLLVDGDAVMGLPRTTRIAQEF